MAAAAQLSSAAQLGGNRFLLTNLETSVISRSVVGAVGGSHGCPPSPAAWAVLQVGGEGVGRAGCQYRLVCSCNQGPSKKPGSKIPRAQVGLFQECSKNWAMGGVWAGSLEISR